MDGDRTSQVREKINGGALRNKNTSERDGGSFRRDSLRGPFHGVDLRSLDYIPRAALLRKGRTGSLSYKFRSGGGM